MSYNEDFKEVSSCVYLVMSNCWTHMISKGKFTTRPLSQNGIKETREKQTRKLT